MSLAGKRFYDFSRFRIDLTEGVLLRDGEIVPITPKAFELLRVLVENGGHVLSKQDLLRQVWPDTFVEEGNLAFNVSQLRKVLSQNGDRTLFIETVPRRGYRFAPSVTKVNDELPLTATTHVPGSKVWLITSLAAVLVIAGGLVAWSLLVPQASPRALRTRQVSHFGRASGELATDGTRLYYTEVTGGRWMLVQGGMDGGEPSPISTGLGNLNVNLMDISPRNGLLLATFRGLDESRPFWSLPLPAGAPRRLADAAGEFAAWSSDGEKLVYTRGPDLFAANADGTGSKRLAATPGTLIRYPRWSPDGRVVRFTLQDRSESYSLWEVTADGSHVHSLLPDLSHRPLGTSEGEAYGDWTRDGRYFFYTSNREGTHTLWALREHPGAERRAGQKAFLVYTSPFGFAGPVVPGPDNNKIFFVGRQERRELVRYECASHRFTPFLAGIAADGVSVSRDGNWLAYTTYPDHCLWRSKADGTRRLQLTFPPLMAFSPAWSPDGKQIAFHGGARGEEGKVWLISRDGGSRVRVLSPEYTEDSPSWSSEDGRLLLQARAPRVSAASIGLLDLKAGTLSVLPDSQGMGGPSWSPDGRFVTAHDEDQKKLMLFDLARQSWQVLAQGALITRSLWSHDSRYVYFQDFYDGPDQPIFRVRIRGLTRERISPSRQSLPAGVTASYLVGLTADDSPILSLARTNSDIYALDVELP